MPRYWITPMTRQGVGKIRLSRGGTEARDFPRYSAAGKLLFALYEQNALTSRFDNNVELENHLGLWFWETFRRGFDYQDASG